MNVVPPVHDRLEVIASEITPNGLLPVGTAPALMVEMSSRDMARGGLWRAIPAGWERYDRPWPAPDRLGEARLLGTVHVLHGYPTPYDAVIHRVTVTPAGAACGWNAVGLGQEALSYVGLTLEDCGRVDVPMTAMPRQHVVPGNHI
jgi:hypothetical protein